MKRISVFLTLSLAAIITFTSLADAQTLSLAQSTTDKKFVPQGNKISMIFLDFQSTGGDSTFTSLHFKNNASQVYFGKYISRAILYKDSINQGSRTVFDDGLEEEIARINFNTPTTAELQFNSFSETITSGNNQGYFIVYEIADDAPLSATTNIQVTDVGNNTFDFGGKTVVNTATITGFAVKNITSIAPSVVVPGQDLVGMLKIQLKVQGEETDDGFLMTIANQSANFVSDATSKLGVTNVYLYKPILNNIEEFDPNFLSNYELAQSVVAGNFTSGSQVTFSFKGKNSLTLPDGVTKNFFVVYDIGDDIQVTTSTKVQAQVTTLAAKGKESQVSLNINTASPSTPASSLVAGLSFSNVKSIVDTSVNFGQLSQIPILQFQLEANHATINVKSITLQNPGNVPFITSTQDLKNIQTITLYEDTNRDGLFNGVSLGSDTQIANLQLGSGTNQQDRAVIALTAPLTTDLVISPFDSVKDKSVGYNQNNAKRIFAVYNTGRFIETYSSSTGNPFAVSRLENVVGSTNVNNTDFVINLSGALPAAANPEAQVNFQQLSLRLDSVTDISPEFVVQGQTKVPMIAFTLQATTSISSGNIEIFNVGGTYNKFNQGVSKVWLYRDGNNNKVLDSSDTLLTVNDTLPNQSYVDLPGISMSSGLNHFLVLYDIGVRSEVSTTQNIIRAEFSNAEAVGTSLTFGGQSLEVGQVQVREKPLSVSTIEVSALQNGTYLTSTFNAKISIQNTSDSRVVLTKFYPRVYQSSNLGGTDISSEFTYNQAGGITIPPQESLIHTFTMKHTNPITGGTARLDTYVEYIVDNSSGNGTLTRYLTQDGWVGASPVNPQISIQSQTTQYGWSWPAHIKSASVNSSGTSFPFINNDAITAASSFSVVFQNKGQNIDENSFRVVLNGTSLQKTANAVGANSSTYSYEPDTGTLTVSDLGNVSGTLVLSANDNDGNLLPNATFSFQISADVKISDVLFYPNPYLRSTSQPLLLGFNITQPATVTVDIYNNLGVKVYSVERSFNTIGYNNFSITSNTDFMTSGIYLCRVYAVDITGKKSSAQTRLAVY